MPFLDSSATRNSAVLCLEFCLCSCFTFVKEKKNGHETTANWRGKKNETNEKKEKKLSCNYSDSYAGWISSFNQALDRSSSFLAWSAWTANKAAYPFTPRWWYKGHSFQMPYIYIYLYINITYLFTIWAISQLPTWKIYSRTRTHSISS